MIGRTAKVPLDTQRVERQGELELLEEMDVHIDALGRLAGEEAIKAPRLVLGRGALQIHKGWRKGRRVRRGELEGERGDGADARESHQSAMKISSRASEMASAARS